MSAISSRPGISIFALRSPSAMRRIRFDRNSRRRRSTRPTNSQAIKIAPTMLNALRASRSLLPVRMAWAEVCVASCALVRAIFTRPSTSATSSMAKSRLRSSSARCWSPIWSSEARRAKTCWSPRPKSNRCSKVWSRVLRQGPSSRAARFRSMPPTVDSKRSCKGSNRRASDRLKALVKRRVAVVAPFCNSARSR